MSKSRKKKQTVIESERKIEMSQKFSYAFLRVNSHPRTPLNPSLYYKYVQFDVQIPARFWLLSAWKSVLRGCCKADLEYNNVWRLKMFCWETGLKILLITLCVSLYKQFVFLLVLRFDRFQTLLLWNYWFKLARRGRGSIKRYVSHTI